LADDTYALLNAAQDPATGLVPNWSDTLGESADCAGSFECADDFGIDAARTSFRVATDYLWYGKAESKDFLDRTTNWATHEVGIEDVQVNYTVHGEVGSCEDKGGRIISVGSLANGAVSSNQETVNAFAQELKALSATEYPEQALKALYLLQLSGKFTTCER